MGYWNHSQVYPWMHSNGNMKLERMIIRKIKQILTYHCWDWRSRFEKSVDSLTSNGCSQVVDCIPGTSAKHLTTFWYLWLTWSSWEQYKQIQESPQELYKLITLYLGAICTSEFKLGLLTFYLLFGPFLAWFRVNTLKRKLKWVRVI